MSSRMMRQSCPRARPQCPSRNYSSGARTAFVPARDFHAAFAFWPMRQWMGIPHGFCYRDREMTDPSHPSPGGPLASMPKAAQWLFLLAGSALLAVLLELAQLPAALLIGPMLAAIAAGSYGANVRVWRPAFGISQA